MGSSVVTEELHLLTSYKLQQNIRSAMQQKLKQKKNTIKTVEEIEKNHEVDRNNRKKRLERRQTERRNSVQARLAARKKAKQTNALRSSVIFENLDDASVSTIIDKMEYQVITEMGSEICKQGEFAEILYLIIKGTCKVTRDGKKIAELTDENGIFGEGALYPDQNGIALRGATVTSMGSESVQLLCLSKDKFDRLVASNTLSEDCMNKLKKVAEKRAKENDAVAKGSFAKNMLRFKKSVVIMPMVKKQDKKKDQEEKTILTNVIVPLVVSEIKEKKMVEKDVIVPLVVSKMKEKKIVEKEEKTMVTEIEMPLNQQEEQQQQQLRLQQQPPPQQQQQQQQQQPREIGKGWWQMYDANSRHYYYECVGKQSTWEWPQEVPKEIDLKKLPLPLPPPITLKTITEKQPLLLST